MKQEKNIEQRRKKKSRRGREPKGRRWGKKEMGREGRGEKRERRPHEGGEGKKEAPQREISYVKESGLVALFVGG